MQLPDPNNIKYVNNTYLPHNLLEPYINQMYETEMVHDDFNGILALHFIKGLNYDGSKRMIIEWL